MTTSHIEPDRARADISDTRKRRSKKELKKLARTPYHELPDDLRKIIDYMRRHLAENLSAAGENSARSSAQQPHRPT